MFLFAMAATSFISSGMILIELIITCQMNESGGRVEGLILNFSFMALLISSSIWAIYDTYDGVSKVPGDILSEVKKYIDIAYSAGVSNLTKAKSVLFCCVNTLN